MHTRACDVVVFALSCQVGRHSLMPNTNLVLPVVPPVDADDHPPRSFSHGLLWISLTFFTYHANSHPKSMSPSPPADTKPLKAASTTTLADLIGDAPGVIDGCLLPLASIYELLDLACGRCAHGYIGGSCVTVSLDHGEVLAPLCRGDFLRVSARVVAVGSSSLTLRVGAEKERAPVAGGGRPAFLRCFEAQMTFVAIDEKGRPAKGLLSGLQVDGEGGEVGREQEEVRQGKKEVRERVKRAERQNFGFLEKATDDFEEIRESRMSIDDSRVEFRKQYLPRHENFGGIVFGMYTIWIL